MIKRPTDGKDYVLSLSYGKDSLACLGAIEKLGLPLSRIVHVEVWATKTIPAELPPMIEFKEKADKFIKERYGFEVEHITAERERERFSYEDLFYTVKGKKSTHPNTIYGFPMTLRPLCNDRLKLKPMKEINKNSEVVYLGIACDEEERLIKAKANEKFPLDLIGWTEKDAMNWCKENDLVSPIYENTNRGGCWFCHNQKIKELKYLRDNYPKYWDMLLKWDNDSPIPFKTDGHTVHDYDKRLKAEDLGLVPKDRRFRWKMLDTLDI